jgi:hypothetical protein
MILLAGSPGYHHSMPDTRPTMPMPAVQLAVDSAASINEEIDFVPPAITILLKSRLSPLCEYIHPNVRHHISRVRCQRNLYFPVTPGRLTQKQADTTSTRSVRLWPVNLENTG